MAQKRYGIDELANLVGVSRRTVRFYVQQGLLQPPFGVGRGKHYGPEHLARLRAVKALQVQGLSLDDVRRKIAGGDESAEVSALAATPVSEVAGSRWTRLDVAPGIELHLTGRHRTPSARGLQELEAWCRRNLGGEDDDGEVFPERLRKLAEQLRQSEKTKSDDDAGAE
jgi:DNA-binding transcriptional MerR regulator